MYEFDFLPVGDSDKSGDAITLRYSNPGPNGGYITGVIDGGFEDDGDAIVEHIHDYYGTDSVDFVVSTHPDADHINGMGNVMRELKVANLLIHRPAEHGYPKNSGARPAEELVQLALDQKTEVFEPFQGLPGFNNTMLVAGPTLDYYVDMLAEQEVTAKAAAPSLGKSLLAEAARVVRRTLDSFPVEIFFDDAGGTNPRNNSSVILSFLIDGDHILLPSDAGVPAITQALDYLDGQGRTARWPRLFALPHHGSRHNLDRATIDRILGGPSSGKLGEAAASVSIESERPSPRIANAAGRRGYPVYTTKGKYLWVHSADAPARNWPAATPLPPLVEDDHDD